MCGRFYVPEDSEITMLRKVMENLESRNVTVKTGEVSPGDVAAVIASNRELKPQPFGMLWGYHLLNGKLLFNARSETAAERSTDAARFLRLTILNGKRLRLGRPSMQSRQKNPRGCCWLVSIASRAIGLYSRFSLAHRLKTLP